MKIYVLIREYPISGYEATEVLRAFRHQVHATNVKKKLAKEAKYLDSVLYIISIDLED